ncbi:MAG: hypothetical protein ACTSYA_13020 [Candidatus Kariarchaeaceae archaeon]
MRNQGKDPTLPLTTAVLEGYNRIMRTRERIALCFRSLETVKAVAYIQADYHNLKLGAG